MARPANRQRARHGAVFILCLGFCGCLSGPLQLAPPNQSTVKATQASAPPRWAGTGDWGDPVTQDTQTIVDSARTSPAIPQATPAAAGNVLPVSASTVPTDAFGEAREALARLESYSAEEKPEPKPVFQIRGRIQAEAALVQQSARDQAILGTIENGYGFRRARLGAQGDVGEQVHWVSEFDFAGGNINFKDVYVAVQQLPIVGAIRVGHFCEPFSLEGATSSNVFPFVERSSADALDPSRNWGVGLFSYTENQRLTFQAGAFRSGTASDGNDLGNGNDMAYTCRLTALLWYENSSDVYRLLHIGGAFSQQKPPNDVVTFSQAPQSNLIDISDDPLSPFVKNLTINATQLQRYNVQSALVLGPLSFHAEWNAAYIEQIGGGPVFLHGGYVFASYFLTGEHREYVPTEGAFGTTHVRSPFLCMKGKPALRCGPGAWELVARVDYLHFASSNLPPQSNGLLQGDDVAETTLGVNWYLNDNARVMFNFVHAVPVDPNYGPSWANAFFVETAVFW